MRRKSTRSSTKSSPEKVKETKKTRRQSRRQKQQSSSESDSEDDIPLAQTQMLEGNEERKLESPPEPDTVWKVTQAQTQNDEDLPKIKLCLSRPTERTSKRLRNKSVSYLEDDIPSPGEKNARRSRRRTGSPKREDFEESEEKRSKGKSKGKHKSKHDPTSPADETSQSEISENVQVTAQSPQIDNVDNNDADIVDHGLNQTDDRCNTDGADKSDCKDVVGVSTAQVVCAGDIQLPPGSGDGGEQKTELLVPMGLSDVATAEITEEVLTSVNATSEERPPMHETSTDALEVSEDKQDLSSPVESNKDVCSGQVENSSCDNEVIEETQTKNNDHVIETDDAQTTRAIDYSDKSQEPMETTSETIDSSEDIQIHHKIQDEPSAVHLDNESEVEVKNTDVEVMEEVKEAEHVPIVDEEPAEINKEPVQSIRAVDASLNDVKVVEKPLNIAKIAEEPLSIPNAESSSIADVDGKATKVMEEAEGASQMMKVNEGGTKVNKEMVQEADVTNESQNERKGEKKMEVAKEDVGCDENSTKIEDFCNKADTGAPQGIAELDVETLQKVMMGNIAAVQEIMKIDVRAMQEVMNIKALQGAIVAPLVQHVKIDEPCERSTTPEPIPEKICVEVKTPFVAEPMDVDSDEDFTYRRVDHRAKKEGTDEENTQEMTEQPRRSFDEENVITTKKCLDEVATDECDGQYSHDLPIHETVSRIDIEENVFSNKPAAIQMEDSSRPDAAGSLEKSVPEKGSKDVVEINRREQKSSKRTTKNSTSESVETKSSASRSGRIGSQENIRKQEIKLKRRDPSNDDDEQRETKRGHKWGNNSVALKTLGNLHEISTEVFLEMCPGVTLLEEREVKLEPRERHLSFTVPEPRRVEEKPVYEHRQHLETKETERTTDMSVDNIIAMNRKISIVDDDASKLKPPPSPAKNETSDVLYITNLVRPFTLKQLRELLERTGNITENGFWTDRIKSKCYVQYQSIEEAEATRNALHGVHWPICNGKKLIIDFDTADGLEKARNPPVVVPIPAPVPEKENREPESLPVKKTHKEREEIEKDGKPKVGHNVWEVDSMKEEIHVRRSRSKERIDKRKYSRSRLSRTPSEDYLKKKQKKSEEAVPQRAMDDLFKKTESTPCIYWQPLSPEEIALKQQQRLERMAEHKRRMETQTRSKRGTDHPRGGGGPYRRRY